MHILIGFARAVDALNRAVGRAVAWLAVATVLICAGVVVLRYAFGIGLIWLQELYIWTHAAVFMLGSAYALHEGAHIRTDFFFEKWSVRTRGLIDSIAYILFFFPALMLFLIVSGGEAWYAFEIGETSEQTPWRPLLWPFKAVIPLTCLLLMIQGVSETIKSLYAVRTGVEIDHKARTEV